MTKEEKTEDPFPVSVIALDRGDVEVAVGLLDTDVQEVLCAIKWDAELVGKIVDNLRLDLKDYYFDEVLLPRAIRDVLKEEVKATEEKRKFLSGLKRFIQGKKEKK